MNFVLDTNICSAHFRRPGGLTHRFIQYGGRLFVPSVVIAELYAGAYHVANPSTLLAYIADLLTDARVLDFDLACAARFGEIRGRLLQRGLAIPAVDLMIATVTLEHDCTLVTRNTKDFQNVPGLRLENWLSQ